MLKKIELSFLFLLNTLFFFFISNAKAQEIRIIDNKGTINNVRNNNVTVSAIAPIGPVENDIWFDTSTTPNEIKIYDGTTWLDIDGHRGIEGGIFFADDNDGAPIEDEAQFYWDDSNDRLYVGNLSRITNTNKLNVGGTTRTSGLNNSDGTETQPSYRFSDDSDTGMYSSDTNELSFSTAGNNALTITDDQNITIHSLDTGDETDQLVVAGTDGVLKKVELSAIVPTIYAAGKVNADGTTTAASIYNASVTKLTTNNPNGTGTGGTEGDYLITFDTALPDANYIIQLTILDCGGDCPGNTGTDYDDPGITYYSQDEFGFSVNIGDSDNGGNEKDDIDLDFMFTVIILP